MKECSLMALPDFQEPSQWPPVARCQPLPISSDHIKAPLLPHGLL